MKRLIGSIVFALGFACIGQADAAVETYTVDMNGYEVVVFVGAMPADIAQAERLAKIWEAQRHLGLKPQSIKAVAIRQSPSVSLTDAELRSAIISAALARGP